MAAAAAREVKSMAAARERSCTIRDCECCWLYLPQIPHISPWSDHVCIPDGADDLRPAWSLLVGVTDGDGASSSSIRVSRLRVARSGRILGRSDDKLELFHDIVLARPSAYSFDVDAALAPDGRSLCVLRTEDNEQPRALQLQLDDTKEELPLPDIEGSKNTPCMPISAAGHIWALSGIGHSGKVWVIARCLVDGWEQVGDPFSSPLTHYMFPDWGGWFLQGYAVAKDIILVSFQNYGLFLTFAPNSGCWTPVRTDATRSEEYLPIKGRGIYIEQHDAVYMLWENTIYAYKLTRRCQDHQLQLCLHPPIKVGVVCPFGLEKGYGFLTRLADHILCSVWISLALHEPCPCKDLHAIVTTFHIPDPAQGGIQVLHSTYRRVDMVPNPDHQEFCFLQEYEEEGTPAQQDSPQHEVNQPPTYRRVDMVPNPDHQQFCFLQEYQDEGSPALLQHKEEPEDSSQHHGNEPSKMLACCSSRIASLSIPPFCFECGRKGHFAWQCPEKRWPSLSHVVTVNPVTTTMKKDLFIVCQAGSHAVIFQTGTMDDYDKPLQKCYVPHGGDLHFFESGSKIYTVTGEGMLEFSLNKHWKTIKRSVGQTIADPFIMVIRVGEKTIAITDTLRVFYQTKCTHPSASWLPYRTKGDDVCRKVKVSVSGYVVVNDDSFIICDALSRLCFLFDMGAKQWRVAKPWAAFKEDLSRTSGLLNGRCVFVDGFIYTCRKGGLAAYELVAESGCEYICKPIFLPFSWNANCVGKDMCLDYAGKDKDSGAIFFYVVQGGYSPPKHAVQITTVKVKTKRRPGKKIIPVGIDSVVRVTRYLRLKKTIDNKGFDTRCCFAA